MNLGRGVRSTNHGIADIAPRVSRRTFATTMALAGLSTLSSLEVCAQAGRVAGRKVDTHHHILPPEYVRLVGRSAIGRPAPNGAMPDWGIAASLQAMDEGEVTKAIVSVSAPGIWFNDVALARRLARSCNEFSAQMVADHPSRFGFFASLPLPDVAASLSELTHAIERLKCDGVVLMTNYGDRYLGDPSFSPVFDEINRRGLVVYVHPDECGCDRDVLPGIPASMIEFPHSTTRTIVSLLDSGAFVRYSRIRFIFSHAGGTIALLASRVSNVATAIGKPGWIDQLRTLYYDTAGSTNETAFGALLRLVSSKQILLGSDFPFAGSQAIRTTVTNLQTLGLSGEQIRDIEGENALRLFASASA